MEVEAKLLMNLPVEMIDEILSFLTYDQIAKLRPVSRKLNSICSNKLNLGFCLLEQFHNRCLRQVKSKLPRRESERKHHPLSRHSDILMSVETRLSMLAMTFSKYIEAQQCCFIPGKVLDEGFRVLRLVSNSSTPHGVEPQYPTLPRPHDFLQEFRDVSSMAMEHFEDKILPPIRDKMKIENSHQLSLRNGLGRTIMAECRKVGQFFRYNIAASSTIKLIVDPSGTNGNTNQKCNCPSQTNQTIGVSKGTYLHKMFQHHKTKINRNKKSVSSNRKQIIRLSKQNTDLKRCLVQQQGFIKQLRRELRETRSTVNMLSKDLSRANIDQSVRAVVDNIADTKCSNLSVVATASVSIPGEPEVSTRQQGTKRKYECLEDDGNESENTETKLSWL